MKSKAAKLVAASTLALLSACASPNGDAQQITADQILEPKQDHVPAEYRCPPVVIPKARAQALAAEEGMLGRMVDSLIADGEIPVDPEHAQRQRSKEPVPFMLGPHTFRLHRNFFYFQNAPSFKPSDNSVSVSLQWPCLEPLPQGHDFADNPDTSVRAIRANIDYIGVPLGEVMRRRIEPIDPDDPKKRADPMENLDLRIRGEPIHGGLTPYYADIDKVAAYFKEHHPRAADRENILSHAKEWYLRHGAESYPLTVIKCDSREIADGLIVERNTVRDDPDVSRRAACAHEFAIPEFGINVRMSYRRVFLSDWQRLEQRVRLLLTADAAQ